MGNASENDLMLLLFNNTNWANVGNSGGLQGSSSAGSFYIGLATSSPGAGGNQSTNEAAYTGYTREAIARTSSGWTVTGSDPTTAENTAACTFPLCTGGSETEEYVIVGRDSSGNGEIMFFGSLTANLAVSAGITPSFAINALTCTMQ
jgi:hypothetical protein